MAWAGVKVLVHSASVTLSSISTEPGGTAPLPLFDNSDLSGDALTLPYAINGEDTTFYVDLGSTSEEVEVAVYQPDDSSIVRTVQLSTHVVVDADMKPSSDQIVYDTARIDTAVDALEASVGLDLALKADKIGETDIVIGTSSAGFVLADTASTLWRITVNSDGSLTTAEVTP